MSNKSFEKRTPNRSVGETVKVPCFVCKGETRHDVVASSDIDGEQWFGKSCFDYCNQYQIIMCKGCETTSFRICSTDSEDFDEDPETGYLIPNQRIVLYPNRTEGRAPIKDSHLLPPKIQRIYEESLIAINNQQPVLAGIGIRAIVETICKNKKSPGNSLYAQINDLVGLGVLTNDGAKILHKLRTLGNKAAHEVKPHDADMLGLAMDVCDHLLQGVYILPKLAKKL